MTSKKCRRKVINDRDMETPYLLIKGFYHFFYAVANFDVFASVLHSSFFLALLLILNMIPTYRQLMTVEVPPLLMSGSG